MEYALRGIDKPVGVSQFQFTRELPKELQDKLPDPENLEKELMKEFYLLQDETKKEEES